MTPLPTKRPWSMKWVIIAIAVFIVGYTWVMIKYRKPTPAFRPYQDSVNQATVTRLLASGYQRQTLAVERPADPARGLVLDAGDTAAMPLKAAGGLSKELDYALVEKPLLAENFDKVTVPAASAKGQDYRMLVSANLQDNQRLITSALLFRRDREVTILPVFEPLNGKLETRWKDTSFIITIPAGTLPPGDYEALLVGAKDSRKWSFPVRP
jgi:hypothetical protein